MTDHHTGRLAGKVALITGTSPNIGGVVASGFAAEGANVACNDVRAEVAVDRVERIIAASTGGGDGEAMAIPGDVTDPDAMAAVLNAQGDITVHAATSPYAEIEKKAGLHAISDLYAVAGGPVTGLNFVSTEQFQKANPVTFDAVVAAFDEAISWVNADKRRAAQFYLDASKDKMSVDELTQIISSPDYIYGQTPLGVGAAMDVMYKAGAIKTKPQSWKDMYFPEAQKLPGN